MGRPARKQHAGLLLAVLVCMAGAVHVQAAAEQNGNWNLPSLWQPLLRLAQRATKAGEARGAAHVASAGAPQTVSAVPAVVLPEILPPPPSPAQQQEQQAPIIEAPQGEQTPAAGAEGDSLPASRVVAVGQDTYLEPAEEEDAGIASAGPEVAKTTGNKDTQAGCSCLSSWTSNGTVQSGCANPDNDPLGTWCPVDPSECLGYYSMFRTAKGNLRYFDYCGEVRERTSSGCLCSADWSLGDDVGKQHYRDGCAQPEGPNGKRICRVDPATCPQELESEFDECAAKAQPLVLKQAATWHNCACLKGWTYKYGDGTEGTFDSCANPDGDPLGHWCQVDPAQCDNYATVVKKGQTVSIGYCASRFKQPEPTTCVAKLGLGDQCGGKSNCSSSLGCVNAPWPGACCPSGSECRRRDAVFQCMAVDTSAIVLASMPADTRSSTSATADKAEEVAAPAAADSDHRIWTQLRIAADYDALMADPVKLQAFKQDVAACLRESIGHPEYLQGAAVDAVIKGSVVALSSIDFKPDTPQAFVDVAREELAVSVPLMYEKKALDQTWGPVITFRTAQTKAALQGSQRSDLAAAATPAAASKRASPQAVGASVAVTVCAVCVLLIVGVVIAKRRAGSVATAAPAGDVEEAGAGGVSKVTAAAKQLISSWKRGSADGSSNGTAGVWHIAAGKLFSPRADRTQHSAFMITNIASAASSSSSSALKGKLAPISPRGSGLIPAGGLQPCGDAVLSTEELMARAEQGDYSDAGASCIMVPPPSPRTRSSVFMVAPPTDTATTAAALVAATTAAAAASAAARPKSPRPAGRVSPSLARAASPSTMAAARTQMAAAAAKAAAAWPRTAVARSRQPASPKAWAAAPPVTHFSVPDVSPRGGVSSSPPGVLELRPKLCVPAHPLDCVPGAASHELDELSPECTSLADHASLAEPAINCLAYAAQPSPAAASGKKKAPGASRSPSPNPNGASSVVMGARRLLSGSSIAPFFQAMSRATRGSFGGPSKGEAAAATSSSSAAPAPAAPAAPAPAPTPSEAAAPQQPMLSAGGATEYHSDNGSTRGSLLGEGSAFDSFMAAPQQEEAAAAAAAAAPAPQAPARPSPKSWAVVAAQPAWKRGQQ